MNCHPIKPLLVLALASCGGEAPERRIPEDASEVAAADTGPAGKLEAMAMLPAIRATLDSMVRDPGMMKAAGARYPAEAKQLVDAMRADMTRLGMHSDPAYEALADSVVRGSSELSTATGVELEHLVTRHMDQVRRLSAVYQTMVGM